jgi:hypothetical protein
MYETIETHARAVLTLNILFIGTVLKMKSVENILGYIRGQFYRFSSTLKCSKLILFLGNKKLECQV